MGLKICRHPEALDLPQLRAPARICGWSQRLTAGSEYRNGKCIGALMPWLLFGGPSPASNAGSAHRQRLQVSWARYRPNPISLPALNDFGPSRAPERYETTRLRGTLARDRDLQAIHSSVQSVPAHAPSRPLFRAARGSPGTTKQWASPDRNQMPWRDSTVHWRSAPRVINLH